MRQAASLAVQLSRNRARVARETSYRCSRGSSKLLPASLISTQERGGKAHANTGVTRLNRAASFDIFTGAVPSASVPADTARRTRQADSGGVRSVFVTGDSPPVLVEQEAYTITVVGSGFETNIT